MDMIYELVRHVLKAKYEDIPPNVIESNKKIVLDTLGVIIAGSSVLGCKELVDFVKEEDGKQEGTILIYGGKVPAPSAALANCTMARALDLDDLHRGGEDGKSVGGHLSATFIPATFVLAEYSKRPITGRDFILASTLGWDLSCRLRMALKVYQGWLAETFAPFGVVATGGKLLGFDEETMINGMGIAYAQCSCNTQANSDGGLTIRLQQGLGARAGVLATKLAERGFTGARNVLQGTYGLYPLYCRNQYDPTVVTNELGKQFELANVSVKLYPCCGCTHNAIYGTLEILKEHNIKPEEIQEIVITTNTSDYTQVAEGKARYRPDNIMEAQFSLPYTVATAVLKGGVFISDFTEEAIRDEKVLEIAQRVKVKIDPELDKITQLPPNKIEIKTRDGRQYTKYVEYVKGHPRNPMTMAECIEKFRRCALFSAKPLPEANVARIIEMVERLEEIEDVTEIVKQIA